MRSKDEQDTGVYHVSHISLAIMDWLDQSSEKLHIWQS